MAFSLSKWRAGHLLAAWGAWWLSLGVVTLGPAFSALYRVAGPGGEGSANANAGDAGITFNVLEKNGTVLWSGTASLLSLVLWIAGPPLLLWLVWLVQRPASRLQSSSANAERAALDEATSRPELPEGAPGVPSSRHSEKVPERRIP